MRRNTVLLILIMAASFVLRVGGLEWGFIFDRKLGYVSTVNDDERRELRALGQMNPRNLDFNPDEAQREGPLHPYVVAPFLAAAHIIGYATLAPDETHYKEHPHEMRKLFMVGRLVSSLLGAAGVFAVYALGKRFFNVSLGLLAAALYAVFPIESVQSTYFRSYTLANLLLIGMLWQAMRVARGGKKRTPYLVFGFLGGLAFSTRVAMLPAMVMLPVAELFRRDGIRWRWMGFAALACIGGVVASNPYLLIEPAKTLAAMTSQFQYGGSVFDIAVHVKNIPGVLGAAAKAFTAPALAAAAIGMAIAIRKESSLAWIGAVFAAVYGYAVMLGGAYATIPRFGMPFSPLIALAAAGGLLAARRWIFRAIGRTGSVLAGFAVCAIILYAALYDAAHIAAARRLPTLERAAAWIEANIAPEAEIGVTYRHAHFKELDYTRYVNITELTDDLSGLETARPQYLVLLPDICCDFYKNAYPQRAYDPALAAYGYREIVRFADQPSLGPFIFKNRIDRQVGFEVRVYSLENE